MQGPVSRSDHQIAAKNTNSFELSFTRLWLTTFPELVDFKLWNWYSSLQCWVSFHLNSQNMPLYSQRQEMQMIAIVVQSNFWKQFVGKKVLEGVMSVQHQNQNWLKFLTVCTKNLEKYLVKGLVAFIPWQMLFLKIKCVNYIVFWKIMSEGNMMWIRKRKLKNTAPSKISSKPLMM